MRTSRPDHLGVSTTAAVVRHPIHPMLVIFPICFLVAALAADISFWQTNDPFWARSATWLLGAGVVMGVLVAVAGLIEFLTVSHRSLAAGWIHFLGNATAILLTLANILYRVDEDPGAAVVPFGIILSAVVVAILLVTVCFGGELVPRPRVGAISDKKS